MTISNERLEHFGEEYTKYFRSDITFEQYVDIRVRIENMIIEKNKHEEKNESGRN